MTELDTLRAGIVELVATIRELRDNFCYESAEQANALLEKWDQRVSLLEKWEQRATSLATTTLQASIGARALWRCESCHRLSEVPIPSEVTCDHCGIKHKLENP